MHASSTEMQECLASIFPTLPSSGGRSDDGRSQGHEQQAVDDVVLVGAQVFVGAARSHGWMQPRQKGVLGKGLANAVEVPALSRDLS